MIAPAALPAAMSCGLSPTYTHRSAAIPRRRAPSRTGSPCGLWIVVSSKPTTASKNPPKPKKSIPRSATEPALGRDDAHAVAGVAQLGQRLFSAGILANQIVVHPIVVLSIRRKQLVDVARRVLPHLNPQRNADVVPQHVIRKRRSQHQPLWHAEPTPR